MVLCAISMVASASVTVTLNVDKASRVSVSTYDGTQFELKDGDNTITLEEDGMLVVSPATEDDVISGIQQYDASGNDEGSIDIWGSTAYLNISKQYTDGYTFKITTYNLSEKRTAKCQVYVDDASKVSFSLHYSSEVQLKDGWNEVSFIPDGDNAETPFTVANQTYGLNLFSVKLNGVEVEPEYYYYYVDAKDGDKVEITANYPDVKVPVKFVAEGEKDFITKVTVNDEEVTNWADDDFTAPWGSTVAFYGNTNDYDLKSLYINDEEVSYFSTSKSFAVSETSGYTVKYNAEKYSTINVTINVDDVSHVTLYSGRVYENNPITGLVNGENKVALSTKAGGISFKAAAGCWVESFTDSEGTDYSQISSYSMVPAKDGDVFTIVTKAADRSSRAVLYVDDVTLCSGSFTYAANNYNNSSTPYVFKDYGDGYKELANGINFLDFDPVFDNDVRFNIYSTPESYYFYVNDEQKTFTWGNYTDTLHDGDVWKLYLASEPKFYTVSFSGSFKDVVKDAVVKVSDTSAEQKVLTDTQFEFSVADGTTVKVNDEEIKPTAAGTYLVKIAADTKIVASTSTGIETIASAEAANNDVYSLQGIRLNKVNLPAGVYIINGKKSIVK